MTLLQRAAQERPILVSPPVHCGALLPPPESGRILPEIIFLNAAGNASMLSPVVSTIYYDCRCRCGRWGGTEAFFAQQDRVAHKCHPVSWKNITMEQRLRCMLIALCVLVMASCSCPDCNGSGKQSRTPYGAVPYSEESSARLNSHTSTPCERCEGAGSRVEMSLSGDVKQKNGLKHIRIQTRF